MLQLNKNFDQDSNKENAEPMESNIPKITEQPTNNGQLWVDLYKPRKYTELLSDEGTNRAMLRWVKLWDKVVFNRTVKFSNKFQLKDETDRDLDEDGRPRLKVALVCGPPGLGIYIEYLVRNLVLIVTVLGKTTLAHMVARHAGYNVVEVNASDERTADAFRTILENSTQMKSVIDSSNRPNCVVFDEIDGAPSASIEFLVKFVSGTAAVKKKKGAKQKTNVLKRPIICICNDVYVPALKPLRQIAFVVKFPPTASKFQQTCLSHLYCICFSIRCKIS